MILAIDIGNSNITVGLYSEDKMLHFWRLSTMRSATADDLGVKMRALLDTNSVSLSGIQAVVYGSVVPPLDEPFERMCRRYMDVVPLQVEPGVKTGIDVKYDSPREVGADRIANAVAAGEKWGGPAVIVDFGTATTFDILSAGKEYVGGIILPGVGISTEALFRQAARLPRIDLTVPGRAIGTNTIDSMRSGIVYGYAGAVDSLVGQATSELNEKPKRVVATGGWAKVIAPECDTIDEVDAYLTLEGLRIIYMRNQMI